ncbi:MAG: hypothetical protein HC922_00650 [Leptolyngbyaceae cyanobacterium SM2_3_12]|nr:hypothetical protein [Leptolyngbyaceae cyanobacterium SM2_3_12]
MSLKHFSLIRLLSTVLAGFLVISVLFLGGQAKALQVSDLNKMLTSAGKSYLSSVFDDYSKASTGAYATGLKDAQKVVNELAKQLEQAADPNLKEGQRKAILKDINKSERALRNLGTSFKGLADDTATFDNQLESSVENLLKIVKGDARNNLIKNEESFNQISSIITSLADNTKDVNEDNLLTLAEKFGDNITSLNQAFDLGSKALKTASTFLN